MLCVRMEPLTYILSFFFAFSLCIAATRGIEIEDVVKRLDRMERREMIYKMKIDKLDQLNRIQEHHIGDLQQSRKIQDRKLKELEAEIIHKTQYIEKLNTRVSSLEEELEARKELSEYGKQRASLTAKQGETDSAGLMRFSNASKDEHASESSTKPKRHTTRNRETSQSNIRGITSPSTKQRAIVDQEQPIAFHAVLEKTVSHTGVGQHVPFPTELLDLGGGYHELHGTFISPLAGIYVFSTTLLSYVDPHPEVQAALVKNGNPLARVFGHGDNGRHDQGSVTVTVQLQEGDEVWVELVSPSDDSIYGGRFTSFTGFLLSPVYN